MLQPAVGYFLSSSLGSVRAMVLGRSSRAATVVVRALLRRASSVAARSSSSEHGKVWWCPAPRRTLASSASPPPSSYNVDVWTDTPYLEYIVGLEPEGSTAATSTGGSTLADVRGELRPHPGYTARLIRLRLENGCSVKAREAILDEKSYMRDFGRFWIPMLSDLLGGTHHHFSLEIFTWMKDHPTVLKSARRVELERLYSMMISYAGVVGKMKLARKWFDDMENKGMRKSSQCCNALIIAYAKNWDADSALAIFNGMREYHRECPPNAMTFYILISMYVRRQEWQQMEHTVTACREAGFSLDAITYTTLLSAYAKMGRLDLFDSKLEETKRVLGGQEPFKLTQEMYNSLLVAYAQLNLASRLEETLSEVQEAGMLKAVPMVVLEEMAKSYRRNRLLGALEKLICMVQDTADLKPTSALQSYLVDVYSRGGLLDRLEEYVVKLCEKRAEFVEPLAVELMVTAFARQGELESFYKKLYAAVKEAGFQLASSTYELFLSELAAEGHYELMDAVAGDVPGGMDGCSPRLVRLLHHAYGKWGKRPLKLSQLTKRINEEDEPQEEAAA